MDNLTKSNTAKSSSRIHHDWTHPSTLDSPEFFDRFHHGISRSKRIFKGIEP